MIAAGITLLKNSLAGEHPVYRSFPALTECEVNGQWLWHALSLGDPPPPHPIPPLVVVVSAKNMTTGGAL